MFALIVATIIFHFLPRLVLASESSVVINEFVPNADREWVELYVAGESSEFVKDYYFDDDTDFNADEGNGKKKSLREINADTHPYPTYEFGSFLNNTGDSVVLFTNKGDIVDQYSYHEDPGKDTSIGRSPDTHGSFGTLASATRGSPNVNPAPSTPTTTPKPTKTQSPTNSPSPTTNPSPTVLPNKQDEPDPSISSTKAESAEHQENGEVLSSDVVKNKLVYYPLEQDEKSASESITTEQIDTTSPSGLRPWHFLLVGGLSFTGMVISATWIVMKTQSG